MKVDLAQPAQVAVVPAPVSQTDAQLFYDGTTIAVVYGNSDPSMNRDVVLAKDFPTLQAALDAHITARLGVKLGVVVTKTPDPVVQEAVEPGP